MDTFNIELVFLIFSQMFSAAVKQTVNLYCFFSEAFLKAVSQLPAANMPHQNVANASHKSTPYGNPGEQNMQRGGASSGHAFPNSNRSMGMPRMPMAQGGPFSQGGRLSHRFPNPHDGNQSVDEQKERQKQEVLQVTNYLFSEMLMLLLFKKSYMII